MNYWFLLLAIVLAAFSLLDAKRALADAPVPQAPSDGDDAGAAAEGATDTEADAEGSDDAKAAAHEAELQAVRTRRLVAAAVTGLGAVGALVLAFLGGW